MFGWGRPSRNLPEVDYTENSSSEDEFVSPRRPAVTRASSPALLAIPQLNDNVDEELEQVSQTLKNIGHTQLFRKSSSKCDSEEVVEGIVLGSPAGVTSKANNRANMPDDNEVEVDFEDENGADDDKALEFSRSLKLEYDPLEVAFYFIQLENEMFTCGVKSQWLKRSILVKNLPPKIQADVKSLLILKKSEAPTDLYKQIKTEILRIHAPKQEDNFKKALTRVLVGVPSQLGQQLINDICDKPNKLVGCCCAKAVYTLFCIQLPVNVRSQIADMEFNSETYRAVFKSADKIFLSTKTAEVSAGVAAIGLNTTAPQEDSSASAPQVAATTNRGRPQQQRNRNRQGGGGARSGTGTGGQSKPAKPAKNQNVPSNCCANHKKWSGDAWYCLEPLSCPWVTKVKAKPSTENKN